MARCSITNALPSADRRRHLVAHDVREAFKRVPTDRGRLRVTLYATFAGRIAVQVRYPTGAVAMTTIGVSDSVAKITEHLRFFQSKPTDHLTLKELLLLRHVTESPPPDLWKGEVLGSPDRRRRRAADLVEPRTQRVAAPLRLAREKKWPWRTNLNR